MRSRIVLSVLLALVLLAPAVAFAGVGTSPSDPWAAFGAGNYVLGFVGLLIAALALLRKVAPGFFASDLVGAATALVSSFLGALYTGGAGALSWDGVKAAFVVAVLAMGGYSVVWKRLAKPLLLKIADKFGWAWAQKALTPAVATGVIVTPPGEGPK